MNYSNEIDPLSYSRNSYISAGSLYNEPIIVSRSLETILPVFSLSNKSKISRKF